MNRRSGPRDRDGVAVGPGVGAHRPSVGAAAIGLGHKGTAVDEQRVIGGGNADARLGAVTGGVERRCGEGAGRRNDHTIAAERGSADGQNAPTGRDCPHRAAAVEIDGVVGRGAADYESESASPAAIDCADAGQVQRPTAFHLNACGAGQRCTDCCGEAAADGDDVAARQREVVAAALGDGVAGDVEGHAVGGDAGGVDGDRFAASAAEEGGVAVGPRAGEVGVGGVPVAGGGAVIPGEGGGFCRQGGGDEEGGDGGGEDVGGFTIFHHFGSICCCFS